MKTTKKIVLMGLKMNFLSLQKRSLEVSKSAAKKMTKKKTATFYFSFKAEIEGNSMFCALTMRRSALSQLFADELAPFTKVEFILDA